MRIQVSPAVNGGGIVGRLFWDFDGKPITLPMGKECIPRRGLWRGTGGRCSGDEGDGDKRVSMLSVGFRDWDCVSERISWLINDWSWLG